MAQINLDKRQKKEAALSIDDEAASNCTKYVS